MRSPHGLEIVDLQECALRVEFFDVGAVVYFLRKVLWTVPGFTPEAYAGALRRLHEQIAREGSFVSHRATAPRRESAGVRRRRGLVQLAWLTELML